MTVQAIRWATLYLAVIIPTFVWANDGESRFPEVVEKFDSLNDEAKEALLERLDGSLLSGTGRVTEIARCGWHDESEKWGSDCYRVGLRQGKKRVALYYSDREKNRISGIKMDADFTFNGCAFLGLESRKNLIIVTCDMPDASGLTAARPAKSSASDDDDDDDDDEDVEDIEDDTEDAETVEPVQAEVSTPVVIPTKIRGTFPMRTGEPCANHGTTVVISSRNVSFTSTSKVDCNAAFKITSVENDEPVYRLKVEGKPDFTIMTMGQGIALTEAPDAKFKGQFGTAVVVEPAAVAQVDSAADKVEEPASKPRAKKARKAKKKRKKKKKKKARKKRKTKKVKPLKKASFPKILKVFRRMKKSKRKRFAKRFKAAPVSGRGKVEKFGPCDASDNSKKWGPSCQKVVLKYKKRRAVLYYSKRAAKKIKNLRKGERFKFKRCKGLSIRKTKGLYRLSCDMGRYRHTPKTRPKKKSKKVKKTRPKYPTYTAIEIDRAYNANTVAADLKFKDQRFYITGKVSSIRTSMWGYVKVDLDASGYDEVFCTIDDAHKLYAAKLIKGQSIKLLCTGSGDVMKTPTVTDCVPAD